MLNQRRTSSRAIVVSGATGFLGGELVLRLLSKPSEDRSLICVVRAGSDCEAAERGAKRLPEILGRPPTLEESARCVWIRGDLEQPHLGWNHTRWNDVATQTDEIYHCAASVSFDLPLHEAQRINVDGTRHIFDLAMTARSKPGGFKRFHHVSTAYVSGTSAAVVDANFLPEDKASNFRNTYEQTKARAERFLRQQSAIPVSIYRPSIVGGSSTTGRTTNWNVLYVPMKMVARGQLPVFPHGGRCIVDTVAVDFVVDAMVALSDQPGDDNRSFHLTAGPTAFIVDELLSRTSAEAQRRGGYRPSSTTLLSPRVWSALTVATKVASRSPKGLGSVRTKARLMKRGLSSCDVYVPYTTVDTVFSAGREHDLLRTLGVTMPAGSDYLDTILRYALDHNFGRKPDTDYRWPEPIDRTGAESAREDGSADPVVDEVLRHLSPVRMPIVANGSAVATTGLEVRS